MVTNKKKLTENNYNVNVKINPILLWRIRVERKKKNEQIIKQKKMSPCELTQSDFISTA